MQLKEVTFMIEFVGVAVQVAEDWLQLGNGVASSIDLWRLVRLNH